MNLEPRRLGLADAGELLTLQRAAFVTEAQLHRDPHLPPLTETLAEVRNALTGDRLVLGIRDRGRLICAGRLDLSDDATVATVGRLIAAPDRQGEGLGRTMLVALEAAAPASVTEFRVVTGEHSASNLRRYERAGYVRIGRVPTTPGYDLIALAKHA